MSWCPVPLGSHNLRVPQQVFDAVLEVPKFFSQRAVDHIPVPRGAQPHDGIDSMKRARVGDDGQLSGELADGALGSRGMCHHSY